MVRQIVNIAHHKGQHSPLEKCGQLHTDAIEDKKCDVCYEDVTQNNLDQFFQGKFEDAIDGVKRLFLLIYGTIARKHNKREDYKKLDEDDFTLRQYFHFFPLAIEAFALQVVEKQMQHCNGDKSTKNKRGKQKKEDKPYMGDYRRELEEMKVEVLQRRNMLLGRVSGTNQESTESVSTSSASSSESTSGMGEDTGDESESKGSGHEEANNMAEQKNIIKSWYQAAIQHICEMNKEAKKKEEAPAKIEQAYGILQDSTGEALYLYCLGEREDDNQTVYSVWLEKLPTFIVVTMLNLKPEIDCENLSKLSNLVSKVSTSIAELNVKPEFNCKTLLILFYPL